MRPPDYAYQAQRRQLANYLGVVASPFFIGGTFAASKDIGMSDEQATTLAGAAGDMGMARAVNPEVADEAGIIRPTVTTGVSGRVPYAADSGAAPGPVNFMSNSDRFFVNAANRPDIDPNGTFDVVAHGTDQQIQIVTSNGPVMVDARVAGRLIQNSPGYTDGQSVRLLACNTGACDTGFAQNLANKMGVSVEAPTDLVWAYPNGSMVVAPRLSSNPNSYNFNVPDLANQGTWRTFVPGTKPTP
jgi:filamentous hemagglutinin